MLTRLCFWKHNGRDLASLPNSLENPDWDGTVSSLQGTDFGAPRKFGSDQPRPRGSASRHSQSHPELASPTVRASWNEIECTTSFSSTNDSLAWILGRPPETVHNDKTQPLQGHDTLSEHNTHLTLSFVEKYAHLLAFRDEPTKTDTNDGYRADDDEYYYDEKDDDIDTRSIGASLSPAAEVGAVLSWQDDRLDKILSRYENVCCAMDDGSDYLSSSGSSIWSKSQKEPVGGSSW